MIPLRANMTLFKRPRQVFPRGCFFPIQEREVAQVVPPSDLIRQRVRLEFGDTGVRGSGPDEVLA